MSSHLEHILTTIGNIHPEHASKLSGNNSYLNGAYTSMAESFFGKYEAYLHKINKTIDFGVSCYLHMHDDMLEERIKFIQTGSYSSTSFVEVERRVYGNPEIMTYHMHGLVLAQFLWFEQYERIKFFCDNLNKYATSCTQYLEIGGGHGLYLNEALKLLHSTRRFDLVDISESSLQLAKGIINDPGVNYYLNNSRFHFMNDRWLVVLIAGCCSGKPKYTHH